MSAVTVESGKIVIHVGIVVDKPVDPRGEVIASGNIRDFDPEKTKGLGAGDILGFAAGDPQQTLLSAIRRFAPEIGSIFIVTGLAQQLFDWYFGPGGPGDRRFRRDVTHEVDAFLDRQTQYNSQVGLRQVIITSNDGFRGMNGQGDTNTLRQIRDGTGSGLRHSSIGLADKAIGWRP